METIHTETSARDSVLASLAWFDIFNYPLTAVEVAKYSRLFGSAVSVHDAADVLSSTSLVEQTGGYFRLAGSGSQTAIRQRRFRRAGSKIARAEKVAALFGRLPSVRMIALCNSLAVANADEDSDIDLFVVCRPGTLWLTRLVLAAPLILLGMRPTPTVQRDKICLSFFVSENMLDMSRLHCGVDDPYMRFWTSTIVPLYDAGGVFANFRRQNSSATVIRASNDPTKIGHLENLAKKIQMRRFPQRIREMANIDSRVLISDDILKFHVNDRRELYRDRFQQRLASLSL